MRALPRLPLMAPFARIGLRIAVTCVFGFSVLVLLAIGLLPHTGKYRTLTVLSDSMRPTFERGDLVVARPKPASEVRVGDVITYSIPVDDHHVVSHRVVQVVQRSPTLIVKTRGDANKAADPWVAELSDAKVWVVGGDVPAIGKAIVFLRQPLVHKITVLLAPALLAIFVLHTIWRRREDDHLDINVPLSR